MTFIWKSQTASSGQNAVLLSKPAKILAGCGAVPIMSQKRSAASEESKRNVFPGTLAKSRKLTSILKYHFCFSKLPAKFSWWILALKSPPKCQLGFLGRPDPFSRRRKMLQWRLQYGLSGNLLQSSDYQCRDTVQDSHYSPGPGAGAFCPF